MRAMNVRSWSGCQACCKALWRMASFHSARAGFHLVQQQGAAEGPLLSGAHERAPAEVPEQALRALPLHSVTLSANLGPWQFVGLRAGRCG